MSSAKWAVIVWWPENTCQIPAIRLVAEYRVEAWRRHGWHLLIQDTDVSHPDITDVRHEDERGRR